MCNIRIFILKIIRRTTVRDTSGKIRVSSLRQRQALGEMGKRMEEEGSPEDYLRIRDNQR